MPAERRRIPWRRLHELSRKYRPSTLAAARARNDAVNAFIEKLRGMDSAADEFDENLWGGMVDSVLVHKNGSVTFRFKGGAEVDVG